MLISGQVIEGLALIQKIENLPVGPDDIPELDMMVTDCGEMSTLGTTDSVNGPTVRSRDQCVYNGCHPQNVRKIIRFLLTIVCFRLASCRIPMD